VVDIKIRCACVNGNLIVRFHEAISRYAPSTHTRIHALSVMHTVYDNDNRFPNQWKIIMPRSVNRFSFNRRSRKNRANSRDRCELLQVRSSAHSPNIMQTAIIVIINSADGRTITRFHLRASLASRFCSHVRSREIRARDYCCGIGPRKWNLVRATLCRSLLRR